MRLFGRRKSEGPSFPLDDGTRTRPCLACGNPYFDAAWDPKDRRTWKRPPVCGACARTQEWLVREHVAENAETFLVGNGGERERPTAAHARLDPRIERTRRKHLLRELREARKTVETVRRAEEPVGVALDDLSARFSEWMDDEDDRMRLDLLDDMRVIYPDASDPELEAVVLSFAPRRRRPT